MIEKGGKNEHGRLTALESVSIHPKMLICLTYSFVVFAQYVPDVTIGSYLKQCCRAIEEGVFDDNQE